MDEIEGDYNSKVSQKKLRKEYNFYCKRNKLKGCGDKSIKATLEDRYGAVISQDYEDKQRYWDGIRLKKEWYNSLITSITTYYIKPIYLQATWGY